MAALVLAQALDPAAELRSGRERMEAGDAPGALEHLRRAADAYPTWALAQVELAEALLQVGPDLAGASAALERARKAEPNNPRAWALSGRAAELTGRQDLALEAYAKAVELRPDLTQTQERLGVLLVQAVRYEEAIPHLVEVTLRVPDVRAARAQLAEAFEKVGQVGAAEAELKALVRGYPDSPIWRRRLVELYERTGQKDKAARERKRLDQGRPARKLRSLPRSKR